VQVLVCYIRMRFKVLCVGVNGV